MLESDNGPTTTLGVEGEFMRQLVVISVLLVTLPADADISPWPDVPASEDEMTLIDAEMGLDSVDDATRSRILKIEGLRSFIDEDTYNLVGILWLNPVLAQNQLCILTKYEIYGEAMDSGYEWFEPFVSYRNWLADDTSKCEVVDPSEVDGSLVTYEPIPSDSLIQIIEGSDRLIQAVLSHPDADERFRNDEYDWTLSDVRLPFAIDPDFGFPYEAMLGSGDAQFGPVITFSIQNGEFVVHSVGLWMA